MQTTSKYLLLLILAFILLSCEKDSEALEESLFSSSMRCEVNANSFQSTLLEITMGTNVFQISANNGSSTLTLQLTAPPSIGSFPLNGSTNDLATYEDNFGSTEYVSDEGVINITRYNAELNEIEGNFQFHGTEFFGSGEIDVTEGQFSAILNE